MLPHPDTVCTLSASDYQEGLRDAAQKRLAASAQMDARPRTIRSWPTGPAPASWLKGWVMRTYGAQRVQESRPLPSTETVLAQHGA